jgi:hypothetical protein
VDDKQAGWKHFATECPPARIVNARPAERAARIAEATSSASLACATAAGRR